MWIGPAKPSASRRSSPIDSDAAARSEWIASPALTSGRPRSPMARAARQTSARPWEAALVVAQPQLGEPRALVQHRQQRQADARLGGRVGQRPRQRERILVRAAVAVVLQ